MNSAYRKVLFLISLPNSPEFNAVSEQLESCIDALVKQGVIVRKKIDEESLSEIKDFDIVILVAHHDEQQDALILEDGVLSMADFVRYLPQNYMGIIDMSSCYSAKYLRDIKTKNPNCHVQAPIGQTALQLRLFMYPYIVRLLIENHSLDYREAYLRVLDTVSEELQKGSYYGTSTKLGKTFSSIYAPECVSKGNPFLIQLFIHSEADGSAVELSATNYDSETRLVETSVLPIKLKRGDRLYARLDFITPHQDQVLIDDMLATKSIIWMNAMAKIQFCATLSDGYKEDSLACRMLLESNGQPIGSCYFKLKVAKFNSDAPAEIKLSPYDVNGIKITERKALLAHLEVQKVKLENEIKSESDPGIIQRLKYSESICKNCIDLISSNQKATDNPIKRVFVSSTSDLQKYRAIARQEIISCNMFPEMSDDWEQTSLSPKEECCRRVLNSDILLCILGARYGFVEESLGMSMTEIEYRTALESGKIILVFVIDPLNETNEPIGLANRQLSFINEIKSSRILKFFSDEYSFEKETIRQLSRIQP